METMVREDTIRSIYFGNKDSLLFFLSTIISKLGDKIYLIAMPWLIYDLTESSIAMGFMFLIESLPFLFISPIAGVIADRYSYKKILIVCSIIQVLMLSIISLLLIFQLIEIWNIFILGLILASAGVCFSVVHSTMIPQIFSKKNLIKINTVFQLLDTSSVLVGSSIAGILIGLIGINNVFNLIAILFLFLFVTSLFFSFYKIEHVNSSSSWHQLMEGFQYVKKHPTVGPLSLLTFVVNIANASLIAMLVYFARNELSLNSTELGLVYSASALIQAFTIFLIPIISKFGGMVKLMLINLLISSLGIVIVSLSNDWISLVIGLGIQSAPTILFNVLFRTYRQEIVPINILGRVNGIISMVSRTVFPLAGLFSGFLVSAFNIRIVLLTLAIFSGISILLFIFSPLLKNKENQLNM